MQPIQCNRKRIFQIVVLIPRAITSRQVKFKQCYHMQCATLIITWLYIYEMYYVMKCIRLCLVICA